MQIKSVELMRGIRDKMSQETQGMSWIEEQEYLKAHSNSFQSFLKEMPNKAIQPTPKTLRVSGSAGGS